MKEQEYLVHFHLVILLNRKKYINTNHSEILLEGNIINANDAYVSVRIEKYNSELEDF